MITVEKIYSEMLEVKNGLKGGGTRGFMTVSKKDCKTAGIKWSFVENSAQILGLKIDNRHGRCGHMVSK